jgi:glutathione synthase
VGTGPTLSIAFSGEDNFGAILAAMAVCEALFVVDPPETFSPTADSTWVMVTEALRRGHRPFGALLSDLSLTGGAARAVARPFELDPAIPRLGLGSRAQRRELSSFHVVCMRKDPPVDERYTTATWILDHARTLVVNDPRGLRELNEKLAIARFPDLAPQTFASCNPGELREILGALGGRMILKPVYGFGGRGILLAREDDPNLGSLLELVTADGTRWTIAQEYLPAASEGDKRILLVDGEPIGAVLRVPKTGELRNNFHAGGSPAATILGEADRAICSRVGPVMRELGQFFVGIDVIGGRLTEINVTSPTGMQEINHLDARPENDTMQARFWNALESKLGLGASS